MKNTKPTKSLVFVTRPAFKIPQSARLVKNEVIQYSQITTFWSREWSQKWWTVKKVHAIFNIVYFTKIMVIVLLNELSTTLELSSWNFWGVRSKRDGKSIWALTFSFQSLVVVFRSVQNDDRQVNGPFSALIHSKNFWRLFFLRVL